MGIAVNAIYLMAVSFFALPGASSPLREAHQINALAIASHAAGNITDTAPLALRRPALSDTALPSGHTDISACINTLTVRCETTGLNTEVPRHLVHSFEARVLVDRRADRINSAARLVALSFALHQRGFLHEAEPPLVMALALFADELPADHPHIAVGLNNLAGLYQAQGRFYDAELLFRRSLTIRISSLPAGHPEITVGLMNLAGCYDAQGRHNEAAALLDLAFLSTHKTVRVIPAEPVPTRGDVFWQAAETSDSVGRRLWTEPVPRPATSNK